jgi:hypothetical protein
MLVNVNQWVAWNITGKIEEYMLLHKQLQEDEDENTWLYRVSDVMQ